VIESVIDLVPILDYDNDERRSRNICTVALERHMDAIDVLGQLDRSDEAHRTR